MSARLVGSRRVRAGFTTLILLFALPQFGLLGSSRACSPPKPATVRIRISDGLVSVWPHLVGLPYSIELSQPASHLYSATENIEVRVSADRAGGGLEDDIGAQSHIVPQGNSNITLGRVPKPGVYFTRYVVGGQRFANSFLVLPASNNRFTVEILDAPVASIEVDQNNIAILNKFWKNLTADRLQAAAAAVAPGWFAVNGQNFVVLAAKGIVLTYSGLGFIAVVAEKGIAQDLFTLTLDFVATSLARAADDLFQTHILSDGERNTLKLIIGGINGIVQTALAANQFQRIVSLGQGVSDLVLGGDTDSQVTAKVVGDSIKKFHVLVGLKAP